MAYDANYYEGKRQKLIAKIQKNKDVYLNFQIAEMNKFLNEQKDLQVDMDELTAEQEKSKKENEKIIQTNEPDKKIA